MPRQILVDADELTAALDKVTGMNIVAMLKAMGQVPKTTTVMVTHADRILQMADRTIAMEGGRIVKDTQP